MVAAPITLLMPGAGPAADQDRELVLRHDFSPQDPEYHNRGLPSSRYPPRKDRSRSDNRSPLPLRGEG